MARQVNINRESLRWYDGEDGELVLVYDDGPHWAVAVVRRRLTAVGWSGVIKGQVADDERDEILRNWSGGHPYCWRDRIAYAEHRVRQQLIAGSRSTIQRRP